jgi:hypothetical protein
MKKPLVHIALLLLSALLIAAGFYFGKEVLSSVGCVVLIFFIIMAVRGKFSSEEKNKQL